MNVVVTVDTIVVGSVIVEVSIGNVILPVKVGTAAVEDVDGREVEFVGVAVVDPDEELVEIEVVEVERMAVEFVIVVEVAVETGVVELVRIMAEVVLLDGIDVEKNVPVLLLVVDVAFTPVEVGKAVLVELVVEGTVAFVFPSLPEAQEMFTEGEAAWNEMAPF